ncbi:MAG: 4-carboxymuconolactone decarboxylase [Gammaproteobacteria bacterium]|nr:4-carboxymuconolactone decarboxylase [Gammaproteobacteria bacterium]
MDKEVFETGLAIRKSVLGEAYVENALANADDFSRPFQEYVTEYCWGAIWGSDGLDRKQRSLLNLGMLAGASRWQEFELHFRGSFVNGMTERELQDVIMQIGCYCGIPAGIEAMRVARRVLAERAQREE